MSKNLKPTTGGQHKLNPGSKKYKDLKLFNYSSLQISKFKTKFDLIICGWFLYLLDREYLFKQFD